MAKKSKLSMKEKMARIRSFIKKKTSKIKRKKNTKKLAFPSPTYPFKKKTRRISKTKKNPKKSTYPFHRSGYRVFVRKITASGEMLMREFYWNGQTFNSNKNAAFIYDSEKHARQAVKGFQKRYAGKPVIFGVTNT